jgi:glycosyltransferase involved in cell wall biosynthesis
MADYLFIWWQRRELNPRPRAYESPALPLSYPANIPTISKKYAIMKCSMNILIASEVFYPTVSGVSVTAERLASQMALRGHTVTVITSSKSRAFLKEYRRGYTIYRIPSWPNPFRKSFRFTVFPYFRIRSIFKNLNSDIVHIQDPAMLCSAVTRMARARKIPVVVTNHFTYEYILTYLSWLKPLHPLIKVLMEWDLSAFYNSCTVLTVPTNTTKEYLETSATITIPIHVISNGVDMTQFSVFYQPTELIRRYGLKPDLPLITYVGRMDYEKNLEVLLRAISKIKEELPIQVAMVGSGNSVEELQQLARELGVAELVTWIARLDNRSSLLNQLYHLTSVFCIPSPIETESMVTMEAMASGLPVVAANSGALPELVENGSNGFLVSPDNEEEWAQAIVTILDDDQLRERMARKSIERIAQRDLVKTVNAFNALYEQIIGHSTV